MINVSSIRSYRKLINPDQVIRSAMVVFSELHVSDLSDLSIHFCGNAKIRRLNRDFRGIDKATDVLSFTANEVIPDSQRIYLGDIIISVPYAQKQSAQANKPLIDEIHLLVVHGILHILGYDHSNDSEMKVMWDVQDRIMKKLNEMDPQ